MSGIKPLAALALAAVLLLGFARIKMLAAENENLSRRLTDAQRVNQSLSAELSRNRDALTAREAERRRLADESAALHEKLSEVYDNDPEARLWADALCPDPLIECLLPR